MPQTIAKKREAALIDLSRDSLEPFTLAKSHFRSGSDYCNALALVSAQPITLPCPKAMHLQALGSLTVGQIAA